MTAQSAHDRIGSNKHHFICGQWSRTGHDMMVTGGGDIRQSLQRTPSPGGGSEAGGGESGVVGGVAGEWLPVLSV